MSKKTEIMKEFWEYCDVSTNTTAKRITATALNMLRDFLYRSGPWSGA